MPGIHLRTLSHFDWLDSEKESLLTIPGSYWLCHKKNIYKFIFRYHHTVKNTVKFSYNRELLKIIRRIIKCYPTQGQQFSTQHLLVTYNCTAWTRQDKMFAILKFQQRTNAAAFSHAFVLTINICSSSESLMFDVKSQKNDNQHIKTPVNVHNDQSQNNTHNKNWYKTRKQKDKESERKTIPEDKVLRSSNITDLVMEGLMFTIRQDEDSVAVIEQKTKLEVDEVLENSEKVETKAGEKCLLNSSLLRLENLVTMIDSSHEKNKHRKIDERLDKSSVPSYNALSANNKSCLTPYESQGRYLSNIKNGDSCSIIGNTIEKDNPMQWQSNNEQNRKDGCNSKMEKEDEVVSDISLQSPIFSLGEARLQNKDLLMNDIEKTDKCDTTTEGSSSQSKMINGETFAISEQSKFDKLSQQEANLPRIISDKVITVEQMPLPLQNIVRTYRKRKFSSTNSSDEFQRECKMRQPNAKTLDNAISDTVLSDDECINAHTANNSSFITWTDSEGMKIKKNQSCETIDKNVQETATCANIKEKNNDTQRTLRRNSPSKHGSPRLQDITEDFYYDLLHVHNKDDVQQRRLRQRRRSLNSSDDTKNKIQIEMLKFIQDITEGARVVVKRLNMRKETVNSIC